MILGSCQVLSPTDVVTDVEDAMQPQTQHSEFQGWERLVARWATEATHPAFPGTVVSGRATFEWLADPSALVTRPIPMWKMREPCGRVTLPQEATLSVRTRKCISATCEPGRALTRASKAACGAIEPRARCSRSSL